MSNESFSDENLRELAWRRPLTPAESDQLTAWLQAHPGSKADWGTEAALTDMLRRMPDVPLSSNFTARVLQQVDMLEREARTSLLGRLSLIAKVRRWLPRVALASVVIGGTVFSYQQFEANQQRNLVRSVEVVADVSSLPSPEILQDFEAIRALSQTLPADEELLALMK